jgi:hypothetical protein
MGGLGISPHVSGGQFSNLFKFKDKKAGVGPQHVKPIKITIKSPSKWDQNKAN